MENVDWSRNVGGVPGVKVSAVNGKVIVRAEANNRPIGNEGFQGLTAGTEKIIGAQTVELIRWAFNRGADAAREQLASYAIGTKTTVG